MTDITEALAYLREINRGTVRAKKVEVLADEIERLQADAARNFNRWFYLTCHPEDAELVAREMCFGTKLTRDQFGHVTGEEER